MGAAAARELHVGWALDGELRVQADRELLRLVLRNLLENAVTHSDRGGRIRIAGRRSGPDRTVFEVANTGSALTSEEARLATQRFWRGSASRTEAGLHCGLGLSLVERATTALGGRLELHSEPGGEFIASVELSAGERSPATRSGDEVVSTRG